MAKNTFYIIVILLFVLYTLICTSPLYSSTFLFNDNLKGLEYGNEEYLVYRDSEKIELKFAVYLLKICVVCHIFITLYAPLAVRTIYAFCVLFSVALVWSTLNQATIISPFYKYTPEKYCLILILTLSIIPLIPYSYTKHTFFPFIFFSPEHLKKV